jgi:AcrR family transcriptional regulator
LNREDWLQAGLERLRQDGHRGLKIAQLCDALSVTTGSFYWHFDNIGQFRQELQTYWSDTYLPNLYQQARSRAPAEKLILDELGQLIQEKKAYLIDDAMRCWSQDCPPLKETIRKADRFRTAVILEAARARGEGQQLSADQQLLLGMAWRGSTDMSDQTQRFEALGKITGAAWGSV